MAPPHIAPPVRDVPLGRHFVVIVDLEAELAQGRPQGGTPEGAPEVEPCVVSRGGLQLPQKERQFPRLVLAGVDVGVGRQEMGVVGAPEHHGHQAVHQRLPQLLGHVGVAHGVLEGQVEQELPGQDVLPATVLPVGLPPAAAAGEGGGLLGLAFAVQDVSLCLL